MFEFRIALAPPLLDLLVMQSRGKMRRSWKRLTSPRRLVPTLLVGILLLLYVVQIYIALALNETRTIVDIQTIAPLGMLSILLLKLLGVCIDREKSGAGFRAEETHNLLGGPFSLRQVRLYRVAGHAISIFFTSLFAAVCGIRADRPALAQGQEIQCHQRDRRLAVPDQYPPRQGLVRCLRQAASR